MRKTERWLYNAYVISDQTNPENNGQIKILNAGVQLQKIIQSAIDGDDSQEFGFKIFDLSENGCNLRIKVEKNEGGYPTYVSSRFMSPSNIEGLDDVDAVYDSVKSLDSIFQRKTYEEIKKLMDVHFFGKDEENDQSQNESVEEVDEDQSFTPSSTDSSGSDSSLTEEEKKMQDILKDL